MAIFRTHKIKNFTSINNYLIRDENLSLKDKGMMVVLLSLPETWEYSVLGLESICKESKNTINDILNSLEKNEYLEREKVRDEKGRFKEWKYDIYEIPKTIYEQECPHPKKRDMENRDMKKPYLENSPQLNKDKSNTKKINKRNIHKESYGTYGRIKLTIDEYLKLTNEFGEDFIKQQIELLDEYVESNNNKNKYTNFNLVLRKSIRENWFKQKQDKKSFLELMKEERDKYDN